MEIRIIRLITGEDILCDLVSGDKLDGLVVVKNPVRIVLMPSKADPKTPSIGLAPWCEFSESKMIELQAAHVLYVVKPIAEFQNQYKAMFGGVITAPQRLILPE